MDKKERKYHYTKLFSDPKNVQRAIAMLNSGYSTSIIGKVLNCDRTSVIALKQRKKKEGVKFVRHYRKKLKHVADKKIYEIRLTGEPPVFVPESESSEKLNSGRRYQDYLNKYKQQVGSIQAQRMAKARETILELRKWRKKNKVVHHQDVFMF